jgi:adenine-specific DNA-methyltransferase
MTTAATLGQFFTTDTQLQLQVRNFIRNSSAAVLEPSIGQGDLVLAVRQKLPLAEVVMYEVDTTIELLPGVDRDQVRYQDFLAADLSQSFGTIVGNPPYVKVAGGNLYLSFTQKCFDLLAPGGELIFIVPSDFFKLTGAARLLSSMLEAGTFTDIYHPHNERLFPGASIDVVVYRYCQDASLPKTVRYNGEARYLHANSGLVTFSATDGSGQVPLSTYFDVLVGMISGCESVFKSPELGTLEVLNGKDKVDRYVFATQFPTGDAVVDSHLLHHKATLLSRRIRKFHEGNWWEWGAARNLERVRAASGRQCIYLKTLTRQTEVAFVSTVRELGGGLLLLLPKRDCDLATVVAYLNSQAFREQFTFAGRFKIGQRQAVNCSVLRL